MVPISFTHYPYRFMDQHGPDIAALLGCRQAINVVRLAMEHGGYVAGGFPRKVLHELWIVAPPPATLALHLVRLGAYLGPTCPIGTGWRMSEVEQTRRGDIDIFFPTWDALRTFQRHAGLPAPVRQSSFTDEYILDDRIRVQVIHGYVAPVEAMLRSFDILNAMVAFTATGTIVADGWHELERASSLRVVDWTSRTIITRITKWFNRHEMTSMCESTAREFPGRALELLERLHAQPMQTLLGPCTSTDLLKKMKVLLPTLTNEELVTLSMVYPSDDYDGPLQRLTERSMGTTSSP